MGSIREGRILAVKTVNGKDSVTVRYDGENRSQDVVVARNTAAGNLEALRDTGMKVYIEHQEPGLGVIIHSQRPRM